MSSPAAVTPASGFDIKPVLPYMHDVAEFKNSLNGLHYRWDQLALLGQITGLGTDITETKHAFKSLSDRLVSNLAEQSVKKILDGLTAKAQVSIDILVRNLFERTADIGFLSTDQAIIDYLDHDSPEESARASLQQRFMAYVRKYSVYQDVILMNSNGYVVNHIEREGFSLIGQLTTAPLFEHTLTSNAAYVETYAACDLSPHGTQELFYSAPVKNSKGHRIGVLCLVFKLQDEMGGIFSKLNGSKSNLLDKRSVILTCDQNHHVIASSNPFQIQAGQQLDLDLTRQQDCLLQIGGVDYLCSAKFSAGYQGYMGPGWVGVCVIPLLGAFQAGDAMNAGITAAESSCLDAYGIFPNSLLEIPSLADGIQRQLNRSVWNGKLGNETDPSSLKNSFSSILLNEITHAGVETQQIFQHSISSLDDTARSRVLQDLSNIAALSCDIMDRNLYELANDCRWWALTPSFRKLLRNASLTASDQTTLKETLEYINGLYTVYTNLILFDAKGTYVCSSQPLPFSETLAQQPWVQHTLQGHGEQLYSVSDFLPSQFYADQHTYIYSASIEADDEKRIVGGIGIVFDAQPQFSAMLYDAVYGLNKENPADIESYLLDRNMQVISNLNTTEKVGDALIWPELRDVLMLLDKGNKHAQLVRRGDYIYAVGAFKSSGYREFKSAEDCYHETVYSVAAKRLMPAEAQHKASKPLSFLTHLKKDASAKKDEVSIACFRVADHWYGIDQSAVKRVTGLRNTTSIPNSSPWIAGMSMDGARLLTLVDLAQTHAKAAAASYYPNQDVIVIELTDRDNLSICVGLIVDELGAIREFPKDWLVPDSALFGLNGQADSMVLKLKDGLIQVISTRQLQSLLDQ